MSEMKYIGSDLPVVILRPGELHIARKPTLISTILGSCVAVCIYDPRTGNGAMCHGIMPSRRNDREICFRFVDCAVHHMIMRMVDKKVKNSRKLQAKIFGGANVFDFRPKSTADIISRSVGEQNIAAAHEILEQFEIPIQVERTGGSRGYKLYFYSHTGEVLMRFLSRKNLME